MKILITSGGCKSPIDSVRHVGNFSSGRYGSELALAALDFGHDVWFWYEKGSRLPESEMYEEDTRQGRLVCSPYRDYDEYRHVLDFAKEDGRDPDIIIAAAAISDYVVKEQTEGKISSDQEELTITLKKSEKILPIIRKDYPTSYLVGFKLLSRPTEEQLSNAVNTQFDYGVDAVVYNDIVDLRAGISHRLIFFNPKTHGRKLRERIANNAVEAMLHIINGGEGQKSVMKVEFPETHKTFKMGDAVRKKKGSNWKGLIVGWYSTTLTPEGYAVESHTEIGSVQIYPVAALEHTKLV